MTSLTEGGARRRALVVGTGLIGGSIALGLRRRGWHVSGLDADEAHASEALAREAVDAVGDDLDAEVVFVAVPATSVARVVRDLLADLRRRPDAVITDVSGVKTAIVAEADHPRFVGGHPMAGSERSGFEASDADLFEGKVALLTPTANTPEPAVAMATALWESLGSTVRQLTAEAHDHLVAEISHLPHLAAYALVSAAEADALPLVGRGFVDTTRIAASAEGLWTDIFRENRRPLLDALARYEAVLGHWRDLVARGDWTTLEAEIGRAREVREKLG
jgi:prephenate dehydrogenase